MQALATRRPRPGSTRLWAGTAAFLFSLCPTPTAVRAGAAGPAPVSDEARILRLEDRREPVSSLVPFLGSTQAETRARACLAVGRIAGPATDDPQAALASSVLTQRLREDASARVRESAAFALGLLGTESAGATLARLLVGATEEAGAVREAAVEGLGRCQPDLHPAALERALRDPDPRVVRAALLAVWRGSQAMHLDRILELTRDPDPEIRWRAVYALMRMLGTPTAGRTPAPSGAHFTPEERTRVLLRMLELASDADPRVSLQVFRALGTRNDNPVTDAAAGDAVLAGVTRPDPRLRIEALRSLGSLMAGAGTGLGLGDLLADPDPQVRVTVMETAGRILEPSALIDLLRTVFESGSPWERGTAYQTVIESMGKAGQLEQALQWVRRCQADPDWSVRYTGGAALSDLQAGLEPGPAAALRDSLGLLLERFRLDEPRVAKSVAVAWVVSRAARSRELPALIRDVEPWLTHEDEVLRVLALDGLHESLSDSGAQRLPASLDPLVQAIEPLALDPSSDVRTSLIGLLGRLVNVAHGERAATILFDLAARDPDRLVRQTAIRTLRDQAPEGGVWRTRAAALDPGPQETGLDLEDYAEALRIARLAREATLETGGGKVRVRLFGAAAPLTVCNFVRLAERGYFDGGAWHRVVPDFVAQDGCPRHDGWGGPGYTIRCEINPHRFETGMLGMALSGKDTGGSQFFFTLSDQPHLDGRYTIFGRVLEGQDVLGRIAQGEPIQRVQILFEGGTPGDLR
jgi:cyclophilin family peptidyl-prolyl cis-trans isomerase/HEAT repeat protein